MERKDYQKPAMQVIQLQHRTHLLQASQQSETTGTQDYKWNEYDE